VDVDVDIAGDVEAGNEEEEEEGEEFFDMNAQLGQVVAEMQAVNNELRHEMEEKLVTLQSNMLNEQRRLMQEQTNQFQTLLAGLCLGDAGGLQTAPTPQFPIPPPQFPAPMTPLPGASYPRASSPTPSVTSTTSTTSSMSDMNQMLFKLFLSTVPEYDGQGGAQKLYEYIQLTGAARMMIRSHQQFAAVADKARDWEDVKRLLLKRFTTKEQQLLVRQQLFQIKQTGTVTDYTHRFDMLLMQLTQRDTEETYVAMYLNGLKDEVKRAVSLNSDNLNDLLSLKSAALRYDQ
ncbi:hypothetical protein HK104_007775, partial [Borealophlyctis nickersoniae]